MNKLLDILINDENVVGCSPIYSITNKHCQKLQQQRETGKNLKATQVTVIADKMFWEKKSTEPKCYNAFWKGNKWSCSEYRASKALFLHS